MKVNIQSKNLELTPEIKEYVQKKMDMLDKYFGDVKVINADFEVERTTMRHNKGKIYRAEANIEVPGELLRVEKTEKTLFKAIDKVKDHLTRSIKRYKQKRIDRNREKAKEDI